jgi:DNA replication protein DnaC
MEFRNAIDVVVGKLNSTNNEGDYIQDGLLYCGKCRTPKQTKRMFNGTEKIFGCLCACEIDLRAKEEEQDRIARHIEMINSNKMKAYNNPSSLENTFDKDDNSLPDITQAMKRYVENFRTFLSDGRGLLLHGLVDGGKTFYAECVMNALLDKGYRCKATSFPDLASKSFKDFDKTEFYYLFNSYDLLLIDDMGTERRTDYMQEIIYGVIDTRYTARLPMIITTNLSIEDITNPSDITNKRIFSRILEVCHPIEISQTMHRLKKGREYYLKTKNILGI